MGDQDGRGKQQEERKGSIKRGGQPSRKLEDRIIPCMPLCIFQTEDVVLIDSSTSYPPVMQFLKEAARLSPTWQPLKNPPSQTPFSARKAAHFHLSVLQDLDPSKPYSTSSPTFVPPPTISPSRLPTDKPISSETEEADKIAEESACSRDEPLKFDVIWCQWLLQHASDNDLLAFLKRARKALKEPENMAEGIEIQDSLNVPQNESVEEKELRIRKAKIQIELDHGAGAIFVKENVCTEEEDGTERVIWDDEDSSMTREYLCEVRIEHSSFKRSSPA